MLLGKLTTAQNGQEGLEKFQQDTFDMVITDIQMPVMNGLDMVKEIRKLDRDIPIAVTTAFSDTDFLMRAIECGVDKYIIKPIDMTEMTMVIQKCTNYRHMAQKIEAYDHYSKFLLEQTTPFMFILNDGKCEYTNKNLKGIIDIQTSLTFIENEQKQLRQDWIAYVQENPNKNHIFLFPNSDTKYELSCKYFKNIGKSVFLFKKI